MREFLIAYRNLRSQPGLALTSILVLGLGIGFTTIMFCFVYDSLYRGLPVPDGSRIHSVMGTIPTRSVSKTGISARDFLALQAEQTSMEELAAFYRGTLNLSGTGRPERFQGGYLSANALRSLGISPFLGRGFMEGEDQPGSPRVMVLGHSVWERRFGGDSSVLGRSVRVNGEPATIVGVMPEGFRFPMAEEIWVNLTLDPTAAPSGQMVIAFGKLSEGVSLETARAEFSGITQRLSEAYPDTNNDLRARVDPFTRFTYSDQTEPILLSMLFTVVLVLAAACVNVANLLLARAASRTRELAIMSSLGASRRRIFGHLLTEASVLAFGGACLGVVISKVGIDLMGRAMVESNPDSWMGLTLDRPALLFVLAISILCALVSGVIPGYRASGTGVSELLSDASRGSSSLKIGRLTRLLVTAEVTVSVALLVTAAHIGKSLVELKTTNYGFEREAVLTSRIDLLGDDFPDQNSRQTFLRELMARLHSRAEIERAAVTDFLPGLPARRTRVAIQGEAYGRREDMPIVRMASISPGFFGTFSTNVTQGRDFTFSDTVGSPPVAIVNLSFAERHLQGREAVGAQVRLSSSEDRPWITIVGVAPDLFMQGIGVPETDSEGIYLPIGQRTPSSSSVVVRGTILPLSLVDPLREEVTRLQPDIPLYGVMTVQGALDADLWSADIFGTFFIIFGLGALLLSAIGLYGVMAFSVKKRTKEMGIRMALGARSAQVTGMVLKNGVFQVLIGLGLGLALGGTLSQAFQSVIPMEPWDPLVFLGIATLFLTTTLVAILQPAWRATRVDPVVALGDG